jgi:hypothetical protein
VVITGELAVDVLDGLEIRWLRHASSLAPLDPLWNSKLHHYHKFQTDPLPNHDHIQLPVSFAREPTWNANMSSERKEV